MGGPDILGLLTARGLTLRPRPDGNLEVSPRRLLTDETRQLIREHKAELLAVLDSKGGHSAAEARRQRVLAKLAERPDTKRIVFVDDWSVPDAAILALAVRGVATCELRIPRAKYDAWLLLELIERHGATVN